MKANRLVAGAVLVAMLTGCATSQNTFYSDPMSVGNAEICRTLAGPEATTDLDFQSALRTELRLRGIGESECGKIISDQNVAIGVGAVLGAVIVAAAVSSDNDGHHVGRHHRHHHRRSSETFIDIDIHVPPSAPAPSEQGDWDQYQNASGALVWGCRGVASKQLLDPVRCSGKEMTDARWPSKAF